MTWKKPNFLIVGAPKCGTTAMNAYLKQHPDIYVPEKKELHYFGSDLQFRHDRSESAYQKEFAGWTDETAGGEASVWYLYSTRAAQEIFDFNPTMKIVIMLRNPADMVHAHHSQSMFAGGESITSFEEALDAEEGRKSGEIAPHPTRPTELFYYSEVARYTRQIQRYADVFGRDRLHIIIFDDLRENTGGIYRETLDFLNVDPDYEADLSPRNKNRKFRFKNLHYLVNDPPPALRNMALRLVPRSLLRFTKRKLQTFNTVSAPRDQMSTETRKRLNDVYRDEVQALSEFLDRDLSHWSELE